MPRGDYYTEQEDQFILHSAGALTRAQIAKALGRSQGSIAQRARTLGVSLAISRRWSQAQDEQLRALAGTMQPEEIADAIPRKTEYDVRKRANELGLSLTVIQPFEPSARLTTPVPEDRRQEIADKLTLIRGNRAATKQDTLLVAVDIAADAVRAQANEAH